MTKYKILFTLQYLRDNAYFEVAHSGISCKKLLKLVWSIFLSPSYISTFYQKFGTAQNCPLLYLPPFLYLFPAPSVPGPIFPLFYLFFVLSVLLLSFLCPIYPLFYLFFVLSVPSSFCPLSYLSPPLSVLFPISPLFYLFFVLSVPSPNCSLSYLSPLPPVLCPICPLSYLFFVLYVISCPLCYLLLFFLLPLLSVHSSICSI